MKPFLSFLFFFVFTVLLAVGITKAVESNAMAILGVGVVGYLGLFIRYGCMGH
jgi:hypothetical protein